MMERQLLMKDAALLQIIIYCLRNLQVIIMIKLFNIDNKIPILIECFVEFYGEKYRDIITEKLSNTDIYFYRSPDNLKQSINTEYRNLLVEQEKTFLDKCNVPCNDDLLRAISFGDI